ncbi:MAG: hypothetical protein ACYSR6_13930 [Planctomycetota bacterium]|jgi:hypothetical protein
MELISLLLFLWIFVGIPVMVVWSVVRDRRRKRLKGDNTRIPNQVETEKDTTSRQEDEAREALSRKKHAGGADKIMRKEKELACYEMKPEGNLVITDSGVHCPDGTMISFSEMREVSAPKVLIGVDPRLASPQVESVEGGVLLIEYCQGSGGHRPDEKLIRTCSRDQAERILGEIQAARKVFRQRERGIEPGRERPVVGHCEKCGKPLRVRAHAVKGEMHLTCKCGQQNVITVHEKTTTKTHEAESPPEDSVRYANDSISSPQSSMRTVSIDCIPFPLASNLGDFCGLAEQGRCAMVVKLADFGRIQQEAFSCLMDKYGADHHITRAVFSGARLICQGCARHHRDSPKFALSFLWQERGMPAPSRCPQCSSEKAIFVYEDLSAEDLSAFTARRNLHDKFAKYCGTERYKKFMEVLNGKCAEKGKLLFWQEQVWKGFSDKYKLGIPADLSRVLRFLWPGNLGTNGVGTNGVSP